MLDLCMKGMIGHEISNINIVIGPKNWSRGKNIININGVLNCAKNE